MQNNFINTFCEIRWLALPVARCCIALQLHPGVELGANLKSISHRCHLLEVAFVWDLTEETINLPLGCLQGGPQFCDFRRIRSPLSSERGTCKTVKARFWPWFLGKSPHVFLLSPVSSEAVQPIHPRFCGQTVDCMGILFFFITLKPRVE